METTARLAPLRAAYQALFAGRRARLVMSIALIGLAAVLLLRLSSFMFDPTQKRHSMMPGNPTLSLHSCLSAYIAAADRLGEPGSPLYAPESYPRQAHLVGRGISIGAFEQDKYEYPPPFLLLPKALLLISRDFVVLRAVWFVLSLVAVLVAMGSVAVWLGGKEGLAVAVLTPFCWASFIHLITLQMGNVQFVLFAASIAAMVAFDRNRPALGGALLAFAICTKIYPGLLCLVLLMQRRFRELLMVLGFALFYCAVFVALFGLSPFREFLFFQLPRLLSGEAFAFFKETIESKAANGSIFGLPYRLQLLGLVQNPDAIAPSLNRLYGFALLLFSGWVTWWAHRQVGQDRPLPRVTCAILWIALLNLAALQAPFAPSYTRLGTLWALCIWAPFASRFFRRAALFAAGWLAITLVIPRPQSLLLITGLLAQTAHISINWALLFWASGYARAHSQPCRSGPDE